MKKTLAGLGVLALATLGLTGASFPANALEVQPVSEIVATADAIVATPDAVLTQSEPVVTTTAAEVPVVPVTLEVEPVEVPVAPAESVEAPVAPEVVPEPAEVVVEAPESPVAPEVVAEAPEVVDYWVTGFGHRMALFQSTEEAFALYSTRDDIAGLTLAEQSLHFTQFRGTYKVGYAPADHLLIPSVVNASEVHAFDLTAIVPTEAY